MPNPGMDDFERTPPMPSRARPLLRALAIVLVFLFAGGLIPMVLIEQRDVAGMSVTTFSLDYRLTTVLGAALGAVVATLDALSRSRSTR